MTDNAGIAAPVVDHRSNNFDALRLLGAVLVLVGHTYPIRGAAGAADPAAWGASIQTVGLIIFFSVSGYLISSSWSRDRRLLAYLGKRALRIFPALIAVVLLSMFILGPILTRLSVPEYFANPSLWDYLKNVALSPVYALPGVFENVPFPNAVNGSLWSLPAEFACYLLVPLVFLIFAKARPFVWAVAAVASGTIAFLLTENSIRIVVWGTDAAQAMSVWTYFMMGAAIASAAWLPLRADSALSVLVLATLVTATLPGVAMYVWWFALPYVVVAFGTMRTPVVSRVGRFGDVSYGIYLYAFPVSQTLEFLYPTMSFKLAVLATLVITGALAFGSWYLIERPALRFKPRVKATPVPVATPHVASPANGAEVPTLTA